MFAKVESFSYVRMAPINRTSLPSIRTGLTKPPRQAFNMRGPTGRKSKYWEMGESWVGGTHSTVPVSVLNANRGARGTWVLITAVSKRTAGCLSSSFFLAVRI